MEWSLEYSAARRRFVDAAAAAGLKCERIAAPGEGPRGEDLSLDAAIAGPVESARPRQTLIVSSGLHGVEGPLGSNLQSELLRAGGAERAAAAGWRLVLLHALNPFGFAWRRRADAENIDPNRNFLLAGELYRGAPPLYEALNSWLNPPRPPQRFEQPRFYARAVCEIARHGLPALKQAIAPGQYDFPRGLFYGGGGPSWTHQTLASRMGEWLAGGERVVHLDIHSGLGAWRRWTLLLDYEIQPWQRAWLAARFLPEHWQAAEPEGVAYRARGPLGAWCQSLRPDQEHLYLCAEFGTHSAMRVLAALRAENQSHHWAPRSPVDQRAKQRLVEVFCPPSRSWRRAASQAMESIVERVVTPP